MVETLTRIIGVGNPLMGDDGIGIAAIRLLENEVLPTGVELIDAGCGGLTLLQFFQDCQHAIIVDAAEFRTKPGTIRILHDPASEQLPENNRLLLSHQPGLPEVLAAARRLNCLPQLTLILVQVETCQPQWQLSPRVQMALPKLVRSIFDVIAANHSSDPSR